MDNKKFLMNNGQLTKYNCVNFYWWLRKWCCWVKGITVNKKSLLVYILLIIICHVSNIANAAVDGWIKEGQVWMYEEKGVFKTGWLKYKDKWFYLDENGVMKNGWVKVKDKWYYFSEEGEMVSGWIKVKEKWYYLSDNGSMATGWISYNNKWYYLNPEGDMVINTYIDGYWIDEGGVRKDSATEVNNGSKKVPKIVEEKSLNSNVKPTFKVVKVEDKDGNGCIDEVTIRFNKEVFINNVLNFHLEGGGKASICSSFYYDGINATLRFDYFTYGEGNNVPINAKDIRIINKNTDALTVAEWPWARKPNTDMDGNVIEDGLTVYYR